MKGNVKSRTNMGNSGRRTNMGNSESRALYEKYKGKRIRDGYKLGTVVGWCNDWRLMVAELDDPTGWGKMAASTGIYSEKELKEGDYYWYVLETDIIK